MKSIKNKMRKPSPLQLPGLSPWKIKQQTVQSQQDQQCQNSYKFTKRKHNTIEPRISIKNHKNQIPIKKNKEDQNIEPARRDMSSASFKRYQQQKEDEDIVGKFMRYKEKDCANIKFRNLGSPKNGRKLIRLSQNREQAKQLQFLSPKKCMAKNLQVEMELLDCKFSDSHFESGHSTIQNSPKKSVRTSNVPQTQPQNYNAFATISPVVNCFNVTTNCFSYVSQNKIIVMKDNKPFVIDRPPLQSVLKVRMFNAEQNNVCKMKELLGNSEKNQSQLKAMQKSNYQNDLGIKIKDSKLLGQSGSKRFSGLRSQRGVQRKSQLSKRNLERPYNYNNANDENYQTVTSQRVVVRSRKCDRRKNQQAIDKNERIKNVIIKGGRKMSVL